MSDHDQATSLDHAHRLIKTLSDHIAALHKRLDAHEQRLASHALKHDGHQQAATAHAARLAGHDRQHAAHSRVIGEHDHRLTKLEVARGTHVPTQPVLTHSAASQAEMRKQFVAAVRRGRL